MTKAWRGRIPEAWLEEADRRRRDGRLSLRKLGADAATAVGRDKPFAVSAISDFLHGRISSDDIARGIAKVLKMDMPPVAGREPETQEWCDLGARMYEMAPDMFRKELDALRKLVKALEDYAVRK